ncbi:hypothetical protein O5560_26630, partial [Escherichia coli]|nr:hypothetical protein [Escherichia coli]
MEKDATPKFGSIQVDITEDANLIQTENRKTTPNTQLGPRVIVERNLPTGTYSLRQELIRTGD